MSIEELKQRIEGRQAEVGVIGLGYVGMPLVQAFHAAGFPVTGFDVDRAKVEALAAGRSYIDAVSTEQVREMVAGGRFRATDDFADLERMHAIIVCVPTPLTRTREPDLSYVQRTGEVIRDHLRAGQLVILESTTYPGTTDEVLIPILEGSGLCCGRDFYAAFSPEREDPGNRKFRTRTIPKLVGGVDAQSGELAASLYAQAIETVVRVSHARVAESAKILENMYRAVNIALVNELKMLLDRMGIDVWEVIDAAATKPFGFQPFYPGPGLGGHCIPIDPFYLTWKAREYDLSTRFIELAGEINTSMPNYVVQKVAEALNRRSRTLNGSRGLIVGVAYKKNTDDVRESPAFKIMDLLMERGSSLLFHDPHVVRLPQTRRYQMQVEGVDLHPEILAECDYSLIVTDHDGIDWERLVRGSQLVIDTRNATRDVREGREKIVKA
ncbi:MAG: nucleotide sugar dehydrogenase [Planctomycetes bacterium]|nr:nucleotide sugar dehydrogenase [Planctomycetota bacterium]